jgi:hypothetical protein
VPFEPAAPHHRRDHRAGESDEGRGDDQQARGDRHDSDNDDQMPLRLAVEEGQHRRLFRRGTDRDHARPPGKRESPQLPRVGEWMFAIECEVQLEYVDSRLAEKSQLSSFGVGLDKTPHVRLGRLSRTRHARDLKVGGGRRDVRIDA